MEQKHFSTLVSAGSRRALFMAAALFVSACATTGPARMPAQLAVQDEVGFTITEVGQISGSVRANYDEALLQLSQGDHERGIALLEKVVTAAPGLSAPRIDLGIAYHQAGNLENAERELLRAIEAHPDHPGAHNELGIVYRKAGRFEEARNSYQAALAIYPGFHYARRNLAVLCDLYFADLACALSNYEAYMATVPADEEVSIWIADIRNRMGRSEATP